MKTTKITYIIESRSNLPSNKWHTVFQGTSSVRAHQEYKRICRRDPFMNHKFSVTTTTTVELARTE
jgi:hypothetical protein